MIDKIVKLLKQLKPNELKHIHDEIEADYALGNKWLRKDKRPKEIKKEPHISGFEVEA